MTEDGVVVSVENDRAKVSIKKRKQCDKCGMCLFPDKADSIEFECINKVNAKVDDKVIIKVEKENKLLAVFLAFVVPLLIIGFAFLMDYLVIHWQYSILIISIVLIALWYTVLAFIDKKFIKTGATCPEIVGIVEDKGESDGRNN